MQDYEKTIIQWKKRNINTLQDLEQVLQNYKILFAYHSGAIENSEITYHNTREIFENGKVINYTGNLRTLYEIQNQKICYEFMKQHIVNKTPLTEDFIKKIHKLLTQGTYDENRWNKGERPGQYKIHDYVIGKTDQGALPEEVASEIQELINELVSVKDIGDNILKAAVYFHCKFENIHPFADGNGRLGRTLMNYYLLINNYPPTIIFNDTKDKYYLALDKYDSTGDIYDMVKYVKNSLVQTWTNEHRPQTSLSQILEP